MTPRFQTIYSDETIASAREDYRRGVAVKDILARSGMTTGALYYWLHGGPNLENGPKLPPIPLRRMPPAARTKSLKIRRALLVGRIWRSAERQVRDIEKRMSRANHQPDDRERDARLLAVLVKTLRELSVLDAPASARPSKAMHVDNDEDDERPRDLEEFRRELTRRMEAVAVQREAGVPCEPEPEGA